MPTIGETLREARMRQHLDIADVEAKTKIRAKYLRALENEEFGLLPGSTFVKTFMRTYAEVLGLDPHVLVEEYRARHEPRDDQELQPLAPAPSARERVRTGGPPPPGVLIGAFVVAVLALLLILGVTGDDDDGGETAARTETERRERPRERRPAAPAPATVRLRIVPDGETYVCLDNGLGTERVFEGVITEPQSFRGRRLRLNLGRTGVQMTVNGKEFPLEPSAEPVGFEFTPGESEPIPPEQRPCVA